VVPPGVHLVLDVQQGHVVLLEKEGKEGGKEGRRE
jgi:hypothetical protein